MSEAIFLWIQDFQRRCVCNPSCLIMQHSQFDKLCGLWKVAVHGQYCSFALLRYISFNFKMRPSTVLPTRWTALVHTIHIWWHSSCQFHFSESMYHFNITDTIYRMSLYIITWHTFTETWLHAVQFLPISNYHMTLHTVISFSNIKQTLWNKYGQSYKNIKTKYCVCVCVCIYILYTSNICTFKVCQYQFRNGN